MNRSIISLEEVRKQCAPPPPANSLDVAWVAERLRSALMTAGQPKWIAISDIAEQTALPLTELIAAAAYGHACNWLIYAGGYIHLRPHPDHPYWRPCRAH